MAVVLDATPGGANANSYCTLEEADAYHETRLQTATWDGADDPTKTKALITATRLLDELVEWDGACYTTEQALCWPRIEMYDQREIYIPDDSIPSKLKEAVAEFARLLIEGDRTADTSTDGIKSIKVGDIAVDFKDGESIPARKVMPDAVWQMVGRWGKKVKATSSVKLVRV